jgi:hypothetical protein
MKSKALKFIEENCVVELSEGFFMIKPIENYNKTTHNVNLNLNKCTCQFNQKFNKECSHIKAVKLFKFKEVYNEREKNT